MSIPKSADRLTSRIAIIVLTWNQCEVTLECLSSLAEQHYDAADVIVVDNGSSDDTVERVRLSYPRVTVLETHANLGFVGGNNVGMYHALKGDYTYIMLLNNDTIVDPEMVSEIIRVMEEDPTIGAAGPKMLYYDHPATIWSAGNQVNWHTGECSRLQAESRDDPSDTALQEVDYITGCAICVRREVIDRIGLLDERFFIYFEETDWCIRANRDGWRVVYVPSARLWHKVSAAMGVSSLSTDYYMTRNSLLFLWKNRRGAQRPVSLGLSIARTLKIIAAFSVKNRTPERLRSRTIRLLALRDAMLGRWGKMRSDVEQACASH